MPIVMRLQPATPENVAAFKTENVQKDIVGICVVFLQKFRRDLFGWSSFSDPQLFEISKDVFRENITQELLLASANPFPLLPVHK